MGRLLGHEELKEKTRSLIRRAKPHLSKFRVSALLVTIEGAMFGGVNIEFDNFSNTLHAEEAAICNYFVNSLEIEGHPIYLYIYTPDAEHPALPCGMCRQSLHELFPSLLIVSFTDSIEVSANIKDLLPRAFSLDKR